MIFNRFTTAALLLLAAHAQAVAEIRIGKNDGGYINEYMQWASAVGATGEQVVIAGRCASACTLVLGFVPRERICVTSHGLLAFHQSYLGYTNKATGSIDFLEPSPSGTKQLWDNYPPYIRAWLKKKGGLTGKLLRLEGEELARMFRRCP